MSEAILISVIIPVCHGGTFLKKALLSLHSIDFDCLKLEVLVAGSSADEKAEKIVATQKENSRYALRYIACVGTNRAHHLNCACRASKGQLLVFTDDDCVFPAAWLKQVEKVYNAEPTLGIMGGSDKLHSGGSSFDSALDYVLNSFAGTGGMRRADRLAVGQYYPKLWNMAIPRSIAKEVARLRQKDGFHLFDDALSVHEDVECADRIQGLGKKIVFAPQVNVEHYRDTTFFSFFMRNFNMAGTARLIRVHQIPHLVLAGGWAAMLIVGVVGLFSPLFYNLFIIILSIYGFALILNAALGIKKTGDIKAGLLVPVLMAALHAARGSGYLWYWRNS